MDLVRPTTSYNCPHCKVLSDQGTHGGCKNCGKVKHNRDGFRNVSKEPEA